MILTGTEVLNELTKTHASTRDWINNWIAEVRGSTWKTPQDIKNNYSTVSFIREIVIFNVKGNSYRLEVQVSYAIGVVNAVWAGTHAEYDKRYKNR
jgi:mRNA interferase HigB